jgi:hypothetical protein
LVRYGADLLAKDVHGLTALDVARYGANPAFRRFVESEYRRHRKKLGTRVRTA